MDIDAEIEMLRGLNLARLKERFLEVYGEPARSNHKEHLVRRVAWRIQALREGDLTERARRRAGELANDADLRLNPPKPRKTPEGPGATVTGAIASDNRLPLPGAMLRRTYRGRAIAVRVLQEGFEYEGHVYRSLSAVAKAVTGSHWNGYHFFGIARGGER
ncbi:MAG: DUF2924 domain-containing protein [Phycisphaerales bacterium]|nr:DUF2924 domain-containing protein [Phycisphaerales bacterium]